MSLCSGIMHPGFEGCLPFLSLENVFARECNSSSQFIFIAAWNAIGLYFDGNVFYAFDDSHARDEYGLGYSVGICVLGCLPNIVDLCSYLRVLCASTCGTSHDLLQYDLHEIMFSTMERVRCDRHKSNNLIKLKIGLCTTEKKAEAAHNI